MSNVKKTLRFCAVLLTAAVLALGVVALNVSGENVRADGAYENIQLASFDDATGWSSGAVDTTDKKEGAGSLSFDPSGYANAMSTTIPAKATTLTADNAAVTLWFYSALIDGVKPAGDLNFALLRLGEGPYVDAENIGDFYQWDLRAMVIAGKLQSGWNYLYLPISEAALYGNISLENLKYFHIVGHISYIVKLDDLRLVDLADPAAKPSSSVLISGFDSFEAYSWASVNGTKFIKEELNRLEGSAALKINSGWAQGINTMAFDAYEQRGIAGYNAAVAFWLWVPNHAAYAPNGGIRIANNIDEGAISAASLMVSISAAQITQQVTKDGWNYIAVPLSDCVPSWNFDYNKLIYFDFYGLTTGECPTIVIDELRLVDKTVAANMTAPEWFAEMSSETLLTGFEGTHGTEAYNPAGMYTENLVRQGNTAMQVTGSTGTDIVQSSAEKFLTVTDGIPYGNAAITFWFYIDNVTNIDATDGKFFVLRLSDTNTFGGATGDKFFQFNIGAIAGSAIQTGWNYVVIPFSQPWVVGLNNDALTYTNDWSGFKMSDLKYFQLGGDALKDGAVCAIDRLTIVNLADAANLAAPDIEGITAPAAATSKILHKTTPAAVKTANDYDTVVKVKDPQGTAVTLAADGSFLPQTVGAYEVSYTYSDVSGNTNRVYSVINVADFPPPTITVDTKDITGTAGTVTELPAATAKDGDEVAIATVSISVAKDSVSYDAHLSGRNFTPPEAGNYVVTYSATDIYGLSSTKTVNLTVSQPNAPVITVSNSNDIITGGNKPVVIPSATAKDHYNVALTEIAVTVWKGTVNVTSSMISGNTFTPTESGNYQIKYDVTDSYGTPALTAVVNVKVNDAPVITIKVGENNVTTDQSAAVKTYQVYVFPEVVSVTDDLDTGLKAAIKLFKGEKEITYTTNPNNRYTFTEAGTYTLKYSVADSAGLETVLAVTVTATVSAAPELTVADGYAKTGKTGAEITLAAVSATDDVDSAAQLKIGYIVMLGDEDVTAAMVTGDKFTPAGEGKYKVTVYAEDRDGNRDTFDYDITVSGDDGCKSAAAAPSVFVLIALIAAAFVFMKKRQSKKA